jgi:uncharacterized protein (TIGR02600 family)
MIARASQKTASGMALMLVLIFLVLISVLIFGFFTSVEGQLQAAKNYETGVTVKQLVNSATNLVAAQLVEGTRSTKTRRVPGTKTPIPPGQRLDWASQPGMIRTWNDAGTGWKIFKLYSARDMVVSFDRGGTYSVKNKLTQEVPNKWPEQPALYTDLNEPELAEDPAGRIVRDGRKLRASFPIVDPLALGVDKVDGFKIEKAPGYGGRMLGSGPQIDATTDPTQFVGDGLTANPAPMPVAWLYVLKDGTLTAPTGLDEDDGETAIWRGVAAERTPSRENPIVGRVAFWTDDETCKLNINTASEPTPWDTPRAVSARDVEYGKYQPAEHEFQRYPGHPFSTALSPVLFPGVKLNEIQKEEIYRLIPRVGTGGSMGGTLSAGTIQTDGDRLFANPDELLFEPRIDPGHSDQRLAVVNDSATLPNLRTQLTAERLRRARFFLTTSSRAPEINLYGQPRVSMWPVSLDVSKRTGFDKLAAFCSTLAGGNASQPRVFHFQRSDANSPTVDASAGQNSQLYSQLQRLTNLDVPGFGNSFAAKWGSDRDQVLTEIFDYIRCTNLHDPQPGARPFAAGGQVTPLKIGTTKGFGRFHTISQFGLHFICTRDADLMPPPPPPGSPPPPAGPAPVGLGIQDGVPLNPGERQVEAAFIFEPFSPSVGWPQLQEELTFDIAFTGFSVDGQPLGFAGGAKSLHDGIGPGVMHAEGRNRGGAGGLRGTITGLGGRAYPWMRDSATPRVVAGRVNRGKMHFDGGTAVVKIYAGSGVASTQLVQTITVNFPAADFPIPELVRQGTGPARNLAGNGDLMTTTPPYWWSLADRYANLGGTPYLPSSGEFTAAGRSWPADQAGFPPGFKMGGLFRKEDVVRSMVPSHGDIRLIAAQQTVAATDFVPMESTAGGLWDGTTYHFAHIFTEPAGTQFSYGFANEPSASPGPGPGLYGSNPDDQLTAASYHYSRLPEVRPGVGKVFNHWGDFDNGVAQTVDGAYINKPDEGTPFGNASAPYWSSSFTSRTAVPFSPNRLIPSPGMLGSLPTGVARTAAGQALPWQTLLFRPEVRLDASKNPHPGVGNTGTGVKIPPDHLIMDLFWMPVVDPYAISEPFSTAGKVNLNYEIAPFSYLKRGTALWGALKSEEPLAIPTSAAKIYKLWDDEVADEGWLPDDHSLDAQVGSDWAAAAKGQAPFDKLRKPIDPEATLAAFESKFTAGEIFRSATQICEMNLIHHGAVPGDSETEADFWDKHAITGDNTRERPYANLYGKLTTRSNTFTVHVRAQVLRQSPRKRGESWANWREDGDQRVSEYRGSTTLERYIDPSDPTLAEVATDTNVVVDSAYRLRVVGTRKFVP